MEKKNKFLNNRNERNKNNIFINRDFYNILKLCI